MSDRKALEIHIPKKLSEVMERADKGDRSVLPQIRQVLDEAPDVAEELGNLDRLARSVLIGLVAQENLLLQEAMTRHLDRIVAEIAGPDASPLESLLAEQIVLCWQQLRFAETRRAQIRGCSLEHASHYERCISRAQSRYLQAVKTLAQIRKLGLPSLQVNVATRGGKQVNVSAGQQPQR